MENTVERRSLLKAMATLPFIGMVLKSLFGLPLLGIPFLTPRREEEGPAAAAATPGISLTEPIPPITNRMILTQQELDILAACTPANTALSTFSPADLGPSFWMENGKVLIDRQTGGARQFYSADKRSFPIHPDYEKIYGPWNIAGDHHDARA